MQFDHIVHWVPDLAVAVQQYGTLGFPIQAGGQNPELGTANAAWRSGAAYIEVVAPAGAVPLASRRGPTWQAVTALLDAGGGAPTFAVLVDDAHATAHDLRARGVAVDPPRRGALRLDDGSSAGWTAAVLREGPAWAPFFIDYGYPAEEWSRRFVSDSAAPWSLESFVIETTDGGWTARWLARILGLSEEFDGQGRGRVPLPGCTVTITAGRLDRITTVVLAGANAPAGQVAGLRYTRAEAGRGSQA